MSAINLTSIVPQVLFSDVTYILATASLVALQALKASKNFNRYTLASLAGSLTLAAACCIVSPKIVFLAHSIFTLTYAQHILPQREDRSGPSSDVRPVPAISQLQSEDLSYITNLRPVGIESYLVHWLKEFSSTNYPFWHLRYRNLEEFRRRVWQAVTYQLLSEGTINRGCRNSLDFNGFSLHDAEISGDISTTDWLSDRDHPTHPVATKEKLNALSASDKSCIYLVFQGLINDIEGSLVELAAEIVEIAHQLERRYGRLFDSFLNNQSPKTIDASIHQILTSTLHASAISKEMLCERDSLLKVGQLVVLKLVEKTEAVTQCSFVLEDQTFEFGAIEDSPFHQRILPFKVNAFTDFELQTERVTVNNQMLILAQKKSALEDWRNAILSDTPLNEEVTEVLAPLTDLIIARYLIPSIRGLYVTALTTEPRPKSEPQAQSESGDTLEKSSELLHNSTVEQNDVFGGKFRAAINNWYQLHSSWSLSGSCLISAVLDAIHPSADYKHNMKCGYEEVQKLRSQIAIYLTENKRYWAPFFSNEEELIEHAKNILDSKTYLVDIDIQILAVLLHHPIYVYKLKSNTYRKTNEGQPLPTVVFGEEQTGEPILLFDDHDHYKLMKPKTVAS